MAFVGGFIGSGAVGLWGILAPLGASCSTARAAGCAGSPPSSRCSSSPGSRASWPPTASRRYRPIADKLKADSATIADQFAAASILFADIVDFTPLSDQLQPAEVVGLLDHLFTHFDLLAERYGVEKIKTIGDCYMVAAGVPTPRTDHAPVMALMALDMREAIQSEDGVGHLGLELRIGINSGPVVAGVIGRKRFLYDLWGDAVNMASRMETSSTLGQIQVTRATYELLRDEFELEPRGTVAIKGKGDVETWYLVGPR
jgi:adenylate cyclase